MTDPDRDIARAVDSREPTEADRHRLANLQLEIMDVLWRLGEAPVAAVRDALAEAGRDLAYTTVATMLVKMERKGVVAHRAEGRVFVYRPAVKRERVAEVMTGDLVDGVFGGKPAELISHLLDSADIRGDELSRLKELIARKEAERAARSRKP
jgi:predicted transcriptional regulator